jgi:putative transposase
MLLLSMKANRPRRCLLPRLARIVVPDTPHHVTQRGNRREQVFFGPSDYRLYKALLAEAAAKSMTEVWAYCLMPNHVHLILTPRDADGLRATLAEADRRYTRVINERHGWTGHLWLGRFGSVPMDEDHLAGAVRYVSLNPVRAGLVRRADDWEWSSVRAHLSMQDDGLVTVQPVLDCYPRFGDMLDIVPNGAEMNALDGRRRVEGRSGARNGWRDWA